MLPSHASPTARESINPQTERLLCLCKHVLNKNKTLVGQLNGATAVIREQRIEYEALRQRFRRARDARRTERAAYEIILAEALDQLGRRAEQ
jgi:hypothetical protein